MLRKKKLALSRETVRVLDGGKLASAVGAATANQTLQNKCSYRYSYCTLVTGDTCDCPPLTGDCTFDCGGSGSAAPMNCC